VKQNTYIIQEYKLNENQRIPQTTKADKADKVPCYICSFLMVYSYTTFSNFNWWRNLAL